MHHCFLLHLLLFSWIYFFSATYTSVIEVRQVFINCERKVKRNAPTRFQTQAAGEPCHQKQRSWPLDQIGAFYFLGRGRLLYDGLIFCYPFLSFLVRQGLWWERLSIFYGREALLLCVPWLGAPLLADNFLFMAIMYWYLKYNCYCCVKLKVLTFWKQLLFSGIKRTQLWIHAVLVHPISQIYLVPIACNSSAVLGVSNPSVEEFT